VALFAIFAFMGTAVHGATQIKGKILKVVDGDTVHVQPTGGGNLVKVRMLGMDTPETHLAVKGGVVGQQPWGDQAAAALEKLAPVNASVVVVAEGTDKYGRTLGRIFNRNVDVNLELVEEGWAAPYIICEAPTCNEAFLEQEYIAQYLEACDHARDAKVGIYNPKKPLKELPFEFRLRMQNRRPDKFVGDFTTGAYYAPADYKEVDVCNRIFFMSEKDAKNAGYTPARKN